MAQSVLEQPSTTSKLRAKKGNSRASTLPCTLSTESLLHSSRKDLSVEVVQPARRPNKAARAHWHKIALKSQEALPDLFEIRRFMLRSCIRRLKRAVRTLVVAWRRKKSTVMIQAAVRGCSLRLYWGRVSEASLAIQRTCRGYFVRRHFYDVNRSALLISAYWR
jgi:hypothetical protein